MAGDKGDNVLMWFVIIHLTFVVSAVMMGVLDRITSSQHRGHKGEVVTFALVRLCWVRLQPDTFCSGSVPVAKNSIDTEFRQ